MIHSNESLALLRKERDEAFALRNNSLVWQGRYQALRHVLIVMQEENNEAIEKAAGELERDRA